MKDKVVIITGASRGIGRATAKAFAEKGAKLVLAYHENHKAMQSLAQELPKATEHISVAGNVGREEIVKKILQATEKRFGRADILINNAGAILGSGTVSPSDFEMGMRVNLLSTIMLTQSFVPLLKKQKDANIVNVSSAFGITGAAAVSVYTAAKAGVINYTQSMAVELAPAIRVNSVAPSVINTDMTKVAGPDLINHFIERTPMKRLGLPEEIASAILFLASNDASFITGHTLITDGGYMLIN